MAWFHMPIPVLNTYLANLNRLEAEEHLSRIVTGQATAPAKPAAARRTVEQLQRAANARRKGRPANVHKLRAAGIKVERHTSKGQVSADG